jgi:hypothetical protein
MSLEDIIATTDHQVVSTLRLISWAENEIEAAQARHPQIAERLWHSFTLLAPALPLRWNPRVYRAHCRELLERVAANLDTRPGTAIECCLVLSEVSLRVPLSAGAAGLYARLWRSAGLPPDALSDSSAGYEARHADRIDELEHSLRGRLRQTWRTTPTEPPTEPPAQPGTGPAAQSTP